MAFYAEKRPCILHVEDDVADQILIANQVRRLWSNCHIVAVDTLSAAYNVFKKQVFDLVILDLNLPDTMGPSTVREMKRFNRSTPIIVMTSISSPAMAEMALRMGAKNLCTKDEIARECFFSILEQNILGT